MHALLVPTRWKSALQEDADALANDRHIPLEGRDIAAHDGELLTDFSEALVKHFSLFTEALLKNFVEVVEKSIESLHFLLERCDPDG